MVKTVSPEDFEPTIKQETGLVIGYFTASFCGPCKKQLPILEKFSEENNIKVIKVEIDSARDLASKYNIRSVPTILVFKDGERGISSVGLTPEDKLKKLINP